MGRSFILLIVVFVVAAVLLVFQATQGTASAVVSLNDLALDPKHDRLRIRVAGRVVDDGIDYQLQPRIVLRFKVQEPGNPSGTVPVVYEGLKPDMFMGGRDVLIDGDYREGEIKASQLLTQCPSKYEPPSPGELVKSES